MAFLRDYWQRFLGLFRGHRMDREMQEEMEFHIDCLIQSNIEAGMPKKEARAAAIRSFGGITQIQEEAREGRSFDRVEQLLRELRHTVFSLYKAPGFCITVVVTLALCIGANMATLSILYDLVLKPLPFENPEQLVQVTTPVQRAGPETYRISWTQYQDYKAHADLFGGFAPIRPTVMTLVWDSESTRVKGQRVSAEFFDLMRVKPLLGRFFTEEENYVGRHRVVVLPQRVWENKYHADPKVVGKTIRVIGEPSYTIIGVAPRSLEVFDYNAKFYIPFCVEDYEGSSQFRYSSGGELWARLKPGIRAEAGTAQLRELERRWFEETASARFESDYTPWKGQTSIERPDPLEKPLFLLQGVALLVLLVGFVNIVNLMLSRTGQKSHELAIRHALGAGKYTLGRLMLMESLMLMLAATVAGTALALALLRVINHFILGINPTTVPVELSPVVFASTLGLAGVLALITGLLPVSLFWKAGLIQKVNSSLRSSTAGSGARLLSDSLVVGQVAIVFILLVGAGLLFRSFKKVMAVDPGFDATQVIQGRVDLRGIYGNDRSVDLRQRILEAMKEIPGVEHVSFTQNNPFRNHNTEITWNIVVRGDPVGEEGSRRLMVRHLVAPDFFATMGIPILEGRDFLPSDDKSVFIVDELFVQRHLKGRTAVGAELYSDRYPPQDDEDWAHIVGVAGRANLQGLEKCNGIPIVYAFLNDHTGSWAYTILVRTTRPAGGVMKEMQQKMREIDPDLPLALLGPLDEALDKMLVKRRGVTLLATSFAGLALLLSAVGIYGVLAYEMLKRRREISIRIALGATRGQVTTWVLKQGLKKAGLGLVLGVAGSLLLNRFIRLLLFDVSTFDIATYIGAIALLLLVALAASYFPARRVTRIDPWGVLNG